MVKVKPATPTKKSNKLKNVRDNEGKGKVKKINKLSNKTLRPKGKKRTKKKQEKPAGVVYLSHLPHGFYEEQIERYFSQFGKVTAVSVPRSKGGRARGYAFIEYKHSEIAMIAADTMNNYLMYNRLLKAKYIPPEQQKPPLFVIAKAARENHKTIADKAALAIKHNRKLKNRHLKLSLEAKCAQKLLKKKMSLMKRAEHLGLESDFMVEEANLQAVFQRRREYEASKKNNSIEDNPKVERDKTDSSEEQLTSSEDSEDIPSLEEIDFPSEDVEEVDFPSESEEEDYNKIIPQAKKAADDLLRKNPKTTKQQKLNNKDQAATHSLAELASKKQKKPRLMFSQKKIISDNEKLPENQSKQTLKLATKGKRLSDGKSPKKNTIKQNQIIKPEISKVTICTEKLHPSAKRIKSSVQTSKTKRLSSVVIKVNKNGEEFKLNTPPNVVKQFIKTGQDSAKKLPKERYRNRISVSPNMVHSTKTTHKKGVKSPGQDPAKKLPKKKFKGQISLSPNTQHSTKITHKKGVKSPGQSSSQTPKSSSPPKKLRHRQLKKNVE